MKVNNMLSNKNNSIPNQFIIYDDEWVIFQSYESIIARYSSTVCPLFISLSIFVDPLWTGKCNKGIGRIRQGS